MATGFSFGGTPSTSAAGGVGGFSFGNSATVPASTTTTTGPTGFSFGSIAATPAATPFGAAKTTASGLTVGVATPLTTTLPIPLSTTLPIPLSTTLPIPLSTLPIPLSTLPIPLSTTLPIPLSVPATGFSLGIPPATTTPSLGATTGFGLGLAAKPALTSGLTLGTSGISLGATTTNSSLPFGATSTPSTGLTGFKLGGTNSSTGLNTGLLGTLSAAAPSIFNTTTTSTTSIGLGGVDPKISTTSSGGTGTNGKSSDVKVLKETLIPDMLVQSVDSFQKYIKDEKEVREGIARMSSKPIMKVQEDTAALKQLLSVVSNTLQRNTCAVEKLKREMTQELKNAEMAHRTKDTLPGLQYENTAPTDYFEILSEDFESRMLTYRQQIEVLENHLASLYQPNRHSPAELIALLRKLHETFIALAAQLQQVHEAVKTQKEHYLSYRKIFHGDTKNIFEKHQKIAVRAPVNRNIDQTGPNPFTGITSAAAAAMASVLTRSQQPTGAPPVVGLTGGLTTGGTFGQSGGFGLGTSTLGTSTLGASPYGGGLFGGSTLGISLSVPPPIINTIRPTLSLGTTPLTSIKPLG